MKKQSGYSLIEIMIALLVGLIVVSATISIYVATVGSGSSTIKSARLNHDLDAVMTLMINDIKRAGYWGRAKLNADSRNNPFTTATTNIQIPASIPPNSCILYTYDADGDGFVDPDEYYGFQLRNIKNTPPIIDTIRMRKTDTATADCTDENWEEFIDSTQLTIDNLQFSFTQVDVNGDTDFTDGIDLPATSRCLNVTTNTSYVPPVLPPVTNDICSDPPGNNVVEKRVVNIRLTGHITSDINVIKTINGTVEVRNSRVRLIP